MKITQMRDTISKNGIRYEVTVNTRRWTIEAMIEKEGDEDCICELQGNAANIEDAKFTAFAMVDCIHPIVAKIAVSVSNP